MSGQISVWEQKRLEYRPEIIRVLFVGESRPAGNTYFYCGDSNLARSTREAFERVEGPFADMEAFLAAFCRQGYYLADLCETPVNNLPKPARRAARRAAVSRLAEELKELRPERIVVVMKGIEAEVRDAVELSEHQPETLDVLPFPALGHQRRYVEQLAQLLRAFKRR